MSNASAPAASTAAVPAVGDSATKSTDSKVPVPKAVNHVLSYTVVQHVLQFLFSFSLINRIYQLVFPIYLAVYKQVDANFGSVIQPIDNKADQLLTNFDKTVVPEGEKAVANIKKTVEYPVAHYVKPVNDYSVSHFSQYLPNQQFKFGDNINELEKLVEIGKQLGSALYNSVKTKLEAIGADVASTYKQEVAAATDNTTIGKNITAGVNTATKSYETYVKPLQAQTTAVINDVTQKGKAKAEEIVDQAKSNINRGKKAAEETAKNAEQQLADQQQQISNKLAEKIADNTLASNGVVSASA